MWLKFYLSRVYDHYLIVNSYLNKDWITRGTCHYLVGGGSSKNIQGFWGFCSNFSACLGSLRLKRLEKLHYLNNLLRCKSFLLQQKCAKIITRNNFRMLFDIKNNLSHFVPSINFTLKVSKYWTCSSIENVLNLEKFEAYLFFFCLLRILVEAEPQKKIG